MIRSKSLISEITALGLAFCAGLVAFACWRLGVLAARLPSFGPNLPDGGVNLAASDTETTAFAILTFSVLVGFSLQRWGTRRCGPVLAAVLLGLLAFGLLVSSFLGLEFLVVPLLFGGSLAALLVQGNLLWQLDRQMVRALFTSANALGLIKTPQVTARLMSGLKLLNTVLPLNDAIVFQCSDSEPLQIVARLKSSTGTQNESSRNSFWRDGVKLCERALATRYLALQATQGEAVSSVAVPLSHERETVGVLLLRVNSGFCEDDKSLLQAVGSQFARNLKRHHFSSNSTQNDVFSYLSRSGSKKKLDALCVLTALLTEQRCDANALAGMNDGIAIAYLDGTLALVNPILLGFAGIANDEIRNLDLFGLLDHFRAGVFDEPAIAVRRVLQTGIDYEGELNFADKNQTLGLRISLLRDKNAEPDSGEPIGLGIYVKELTRIKEYEKLKSDMISLMSHELRTPLTSINGFAELLTADDTIPEQAREFVTIIASESQRMSRMINTFLAVTQLERKDKQEFLKIPLRLDEVVHETISTLQPVAKRKRIRLVEQPAHRVPPVAADKSLITQAVKNLVHNAIKYSPERSTVTISTALEAEAVRVCVEDRGYGIPSESRDRVWEKFFRVVREGQEKDEESTGLGLSFVREVIEQHGGRVELDSEEGRGSRFSFTLPRL